MIQSIQFIRHQLENLLNDVQRNAYKNRAGIFVVNVKRLKEFCKSNLFISEIISQIEKTEVDYNDWKQECAFGENGFAPYWGVKQDIHICWLAVQEVAEIKSIKSVKSLQDLSAIGSLDKRDEQTQIIFNRYVTPFVRHLLEQLDFRSFRLSILSRFIQRCQQFDRNAYYERYRSDIEQKTQKGEAHLDLELRRYLFDQGIDTLSSPHGGTGRVDIVTHSPDPLALEVKLYCPKKTYTNGFTQKSNADKKHLKQGFDQLQQAVVSYHSGYGVLFIFNLSDKNLIFETNQAGSPPAIYLNGKTYYIFHADLYPHPSDSKAKKELCLIDTTEWIKGNN